MVITNTRKAIKYYELAIKNAENILSHEIEQDENYQAFQKKYKKKYGYTTIFYSHIQEFSFYDYNKDESIDFFRIVDNEIVYDDNTFDGVKDVAEELLNIVKRFY